MGEVEMLILFFGLVLLRLCRPAESREEVLHCVVCDEPSVVERDYGESFS